MTQDPLILTRLAKRISLLAVITAGVMELISILIKGILPEFTYGLALGTAVSIANFHIMVIFVKRAVRGGNAMGTTFTGYLARFVLYGIAAVISAKTGTASLLGTILGFVTIQIGIYIDAFIGR